MNNSTLPEIDCRKEKQFSFFVFYSTARFSFSDFLIKFFKVNRLSCYQQTQAILLPIDVPHTLLNRHSKNNSY